MNIGRLNRSPAGGWGDLSPPKNDALNWCYFRELYTLYIVKELCIVKGPGIKNGNSVKYQYFPLGYLNANLKVFSNNGKA